MRTTVEPPGGLELEGIQSGRIHWNLSVAALYEEAVRRREGVIAAGGPLVCRTGHHTGRSPNDKFIVRDASSDAEVAWGAVNRAMTPAQFDALHEEMLASLAGRELYVQDCYASAAPTYRLPIRVITELAWHSLFARNLFISEANGSGPVATLRSSRSSMPPASRPIPRGTARTPRSWSP